MNIKVFALLHRLAFTETKIEEYKILHYTLGSIVADVCYFRLLCTG